MNIKPKPVKLLEENTGKKSLQPWVGQRFLRYAKSTIYKRKKNYKLDFVKIKNCSETSLAVHWLRLNASHSTWNSAQ